MRVMSASPSSQLQPGGCHPGAVFSSSNSPTSTVMPSDVLPQLETWILSLLRGSRWLFPGQGGGHITVRRVRQIVHQAAEEAGDKRVDDHDKNGRPLYVVSAHTLRHAHAVTALDAGVPLNDLQAQLGHSNLATTSVYLNANLEHWRKSYERAEFGPR